MEQIRYNLSWYEKNGDAFVNQVWLKGVRVDQLRRLFGASRQDPMYDSRAVGPEQAHVLEGLTGMKIDLGRYDFFVECEALQAQRRARRERASARGGARA